jgi:BA14K-like protein
MTTWKVLPISAVAMMVALAPVQAASVAPPAGSAFKAEVQSNAGITDVQWRGRGWGWGGWGAAPWIGLGAGVVAGAIIADQAYRPRAGYYYDDYAYSGPYYYPSAYRGDPRTICAQNFRSFEWGTGLYTTYTGEKRLCPYLR